MARLKEALQILAAGVEAGGIAIRFAAQSPVADLLGGSTIYASRPFKVGEWITLPGTEVRGEVQAEPGLPASTVRVPEGPQLR